MISVKVEGLRDLEEQLKKIEETARTKILRSATAVAAAVFKKEIESRVPVKTGALKKSIFERRLSKSSTDGIEVFQVNIRKEKSKEYYAKFIEYGTRKMQAKPFIRPSFEAKKEDAIKAFQDRLRSGLKEYGLK